MLLSQGFILLSKTTEERYLTMLDEAEKLYVSAFPCGAPHPTESPHH